MEIAKNRVMAAIHTAGVITDEALERSAGLDKYRLRTAINSLVYDNMIERGRIEGSDADGWQLARRGRMWAASVSGRAALDLPAGDSSASKGLRR
ncbi:hypothetical protein [Nocardia aurea]|uniref:hypothetical protein n=1 Tax=Nocardia aurea TaxID=2144174 RepID=UPI0033A48C0D